MPAISVVIGMYLAIIRDRLLVLRPVSGHIQGLQGVLIECIVREQEGWDVRGSSALLHGKLIVYFWWFMMMMPRICTVEPWLSPAL